ncbi:hypothetical protein CHS0354_021328 [Potamilus streckersoni]|uniref:Heat shock 70 kDa protein 12A n=1 Tax=Potamilus streckersoni TaxID=2493646 RepID=A0AAE0WE25_9BIVA|nr:hypothetical protein CHS0354_021328 [Potamilus streckersoni]
MASTKMLSVALDFGTSCSGYAFSFQHDKETISTSRWAGSDYIKAPTSILFNPQKEFDSFGFEAENKFADLSKTGSHQDWYLFKQFKLVLIKENKLSRSTVINDVSGKKMLAMDVFSSAIKVLKDNIMKDLRGQSTPILNSDIQWVLTVPAIWDDAAKQFMRFAANQAGIPNESLMLVLEPDAAAMSASCSSMFAEGEKCMILDCGGGTIDVSVMKKNSRGSVDCIYRPTGGVWGGTKVDDAFQEFLIAHFGMDRFLRMEMNEVLQVQRSFETAKKKAQEPGVMKAGIWLPLTLRKDIDQLPIKQNIIGDKLNLNVGQVVSFFQKPVSSIVAHLQKIMTELEVDRLKYIIMVGGFSESTILQSEIQNNFPSIDVLVVEDPCSAVLKGAVVLGHNPKVIESKRSAYTYGIKVMTNFIEKYHDKSKLMVIDGETNCKDVFDKVMGINETMKINETKVEKIYGPAYFGQRSCVLSIYKSKNVNPCYVTDPGCEQIGDLVVDMPDLTGEKNRQVAVTTYFGETELRAEAVDKTTGRKYTASFEFLGY